MMAMLGSGEERRGKVPPPRLSTFATLPPHLYKGSPPPPPSQNTLLPPPLDPLLLKLFPLLRLWRASSSSADRSIQIPRRRRGEQGDLRLSVGEGRAVGGRLAGRCEQAGERERERERDLPYGFRPCPFFPSPPDFCYKQKEGGRRGRKRLLLAPSFPPSFLFLFHRLLASVTR